MPLTPSFTVSQDTANLTALILQDTSTGADAAVTQRRVYLQKANGYLKPSSVTTNYVTITGTTPNYIYVLDKDYVLNIRMEWLDAGGAVLYQKSGLYLFSAYGEGLFYALTQLQVATPSLVQDTGYFLNKMKLRCALDEAQNAVTLAADIYGGQAALDRAKYFIDNQKYTF